ncbi:glycosyltransferase involved in cell wall biosynthesis [Crenobacter luteus]|uniref:glycosyltransferase n=1 Tax=Crenobacter luteus TaxID=1452487 RepID=UPI00105257B0|nr:glycosyltransferase [Crenobacter luteus]TCP13085.1 glycosyltransferase involved in cell wall biosynthesis [Crenobacter luteus]
MTRLRLVHLIDLDKVGGVETMFADFVAAAAPAGFDVEHHLVADSPNIAARFLPVVRRCCKTVASPKRWGPFSLPRKPHWVRAHRRRRLIRAARPDLVLVWNQFTDFRLAVPAFDCPVVYYEHGMSWYNHSPRQLESFLPHVDGAIAVSNAAARMLALKHAVRFPVALCTNPIRPGLLPAEAAPRNLAPGQPLRLGVAARLVPLKAVGLAILALQTLAERGVKAELAIAGEGPERGVLEQLARNAGVADRVRWLGLVSDMGAFYRGIDLFVCPSMHETMPLVCLEAMAHGVPVIASRVDGFPEVVAHGVSGVCLAPTLSVDDYAALTGASTAFARRVYDPQADHLIETRLLDPAAIAEAVLTLAEDSATYQRFSAGAIARSKNGFQYPQYLDAFYGILARYLRG